MGRCFDFFTHSSQAMETMVHYILNPAVDDIYFDSVSCFYVNNDRHFLFLIGDYLLQRKLRGNNRGSGRVSSFLAQRGAA